MATSGQPTPPPVAQPTSAKPPESDKQPPEDPGLRAAQEAVQPLKAGDSMFADKIVGAVTHNSGWITINQLPDDRSANPGSFEDDLRELDEPPPLPDSLPFAAELIEHYASVAREQRMLVIVHDRERRQDAKNALLASVRELWNAPDGRKLLASAFDRVFPLYSLYERKEWSERVRRSVIFLDRSDDDNAGQFFNSDPKTAMLRKQLVSMDAHLLVMVGSAGGRPRPGALEGSKHFWHIEAAPSVAPPPEVMPGTPDTFDALVLLCATWFAGLGLQEFRALVDGLLPEPAAAEPRADAAPIGSTPPAPMPSLTRMQRWRNGDIDRVLGELGIAFHQPSDLAGAGAWATDASAGYYLLDPAQRAAASHWMLRRFPMLLMQHLDRLVALYFGPQASGRYCNGLLNLLFRLDSAHIHRLNADWLVQRFVAAAQTHPDAPQHLVDLLAAALDRSEGDTLVRQVALGLARRARESEQALLAELPQAALTAAWAAARPIPPAETVEASQREEAPADAADPSDLFWSSLDESDIVGDRFGRVAGQQVAVARTLLLLCRHEPRAAVDALCNLLEPGALQAVDAAGHPLRIDRLSRLALRWALVRVVADFPLSWLACAEAAGASDQPANSTAGHVAAEPAPARPAAHRWSPSTRALTAECLAALAHHLSQAEGAALPAALYDTLLGNAHRARAARVLAGLLLGLLATADRPADQPDTIDPDVVMWLFRELAGAMLRRDKATATTVATPLHELAAPLRAGLHPSQRRAISDTARRTQDILFDRRDFFETLGLREQLTAERRSLQAMQTVIRAFSGTAPTPA